MEPPCGYRCKVQAVFRSDRSGRIISGVYQSSRNGIVGIDRCMVNDPRADEIIVGIRELMRSFKIRPWDPGTDRGFIKHVLVRIGRNTGEILVTIVGGTSMFPKKRDFVTALVKRFPAIKTVTFSVNRSPDFLTLGDHAGGTFRRRLHHRRDMREEIPYIAAVVLPGKSGAGGETVQLRDKRGKADEKRHAPRRIQRYRAPSNHRFRPC